MEKYLCILKRVDLPDSEVKYEVDLKQNLINNLRCFWSKNKKNAHCIIPSSLDSAIQQGTNLPVTASLTVPAANTSFSLDPLVVLKDQVKDFFPSDYGSGTPLNSIVLQFEDVTQFPLRQFCAMTPVYQNNSKTLDGSSPVNDKNTTVSDRNTTDHPFDANGKLQDELDPDFGKNVTPGGGDSRKNKVNPLIIVLVSLIAVGIIIFIIAGAQNHNRSITEESTSTISESRDQESSENINSRINNYLRTGSYELLAEFYNRSVFQQNGNEEIDTLIIEAIDKLETDYREGNISYEDVTNSLSFLSSLSSDYLSDYAAKKMKDIVDNHQQSVYDVYELSVEETSVEETSVEETSVEETSVEETSVEESSPIDQTDTEPNTHENVPSVTIKPIAEKTLNIKEIAYNKKDIKNTATKTISNTITTEDQVIDYTFRAEVSGTYRFEFQDVNDGVYYDIKVLNMSKQVKKSNSYIGAGSGVTVSLESGNGYIVRVCQNQNYGPYTLLIGMQQATTDISSYTEITDSIQFTDQKNCYSFVPSVEGTHRFEFGDVPDAVYLDIAIFNSGWEKIKSNSYIRSGSGITQSLKEGKIYYIVVYQNQGYGSYSLEIGHKKAGTDIADYTLITDTIQYTDQKNDYYFEPKVSGTHRFEFGDMPDAVYMDMTICNSGWEKIKETDYIRSGSGLTVNLTAGKKYIIQIMQSQNTGYYSLHIGHKKEWVDVTPYKRITDSIQYTDQINNYYFTAPADGKYRFEYDDVPEGTYLDLSIYNSGWEVIKKSSYLRTGQGIDVSLKKGQNIFIAAIYDKDIGSYTLKIIAP